MNQSVLILSAIRTAVSRARLIADDVEHVVIGQVDRSAGRLSRFSGRCPQGFGLSISLKNFPNEEEQTGK